MSYNNVINPMYLIHGTADVQLDYLRSILDNNILALLKMVIPDWLQTDVAIKLNPQTDITECREAITELVLFNTDKFSRRRSSDSASNTDEKFPMKNNHAVPNHNSQSRNHLELKYNQSKGYCLNCSRSNYSTSLCNADTVKVKVNPSSP
ncbi:hypothetical protein ACTFIT_004982 [Dictyostelium discoideum]